MSFTTILIIVNVFAALAIIVLALMQTSKGDMGSAFGGGGSQSMFGSRGSANFLSRSTSLMCVVFFVTSLALAYIYAKRAELNSVVEPSVIEQQAQESDIPTIDVEQPSVNADDIPQVIEESIESSSDGIPSVPVN